jgi:glutamate-1-semialdehyde 2,1-aminomutase
MTQKELVGRGEELRGIASRYMPAGVSASARYNPALGRALAVSHGRGSRIWSVDGDEYIDYNLSHGATFLGHDHPATRRAIETALDAGVVCGYETEHHARVAQLISESIPSAERVRFTNSGTEATMVAVRLARAFTGRSKILKFQGHFHGLHDYTLYNAHNEPEASVDPPFLPLVVESAGIPRELEQFVLVIPWNDPEALDAALERHGDEIAIVMCEPVNYNSGCLTPAPGFLEHLRRATAEHGVVLFFDEVLSGFRMAVGGAQAHYGVTPDLSSFAKAIANGIGVGLLVGRSEIMELVAPVGDVAHSGTFSGHLFTVLAIEASIAEMRKEGFYERIDRIGERLYRGIDDVFEAEGIPTVVRGLGARCGIFFGTRSVESYDDAIAADHELMTAFIREAAGTGLYFHSYGRIAIGHHGFSASHTEEDVDETLKRLGPVAARLAKGAA